MRDDTYLTLTDVQNCPLYGYCTDMGKEEICTHTCTRGDNMNFFLASSNLPKPYWNLDKLDFNELQTDEIARYMKYMFVNIDHFVHRGFNAYFYGWSNTGKTTWATGLLVRYLQFVSSYGTHRVPAVYVNVPELLGDLKYFSGRVNPWLDELMQDIKHCALVVWDDLLLTELTPFEFQTLYRLINGRLAENLSNIFVNDDSPEDLMITNRKLYSKVCNHSSCIEFTQDVTGKVLKFENLIGTTEEDNS